MKMGASPPAGASAPPVKEPSRALELCWSRDTFDRFSIRGVWAVKAGEEWAVGSQLGGPAKGVVYRRSGNAWRLAHEHPHVELLSIWGSAEDDVWIGTDRGTFVHWDGHSFTESTVEQKWPVMAIWGSGRDDIWASGPPHAFLHRRGGAWAPERFSEPAALEASAESQVSALWGTGASDVWAAGYVGLILHFDGQAWRREESGTKEHLRAIGGTGPNDVWAAGSFGVTVRRGPTGWAPAPFPSAFDVTRLAGRGPDDLWASTNRGVVRWDGRSWWNVDIGLEGNVYPQVWSVGSGDIWLTGRGLLRLHSGCTEGVKTEDAFPLVQTPAPPERRAPDTTPDVPVTEAEARTFLSELATVLRADDVARFETRLSWKGKARTVLTKQFQAWKHGLLRIEPRLPGTRFVFERRSQRSTIAFYDDAVTVLFMQVTREDGTLRLDEN